MGLSEKHNTELVCKVNKSATKLTTELREGEAQVVPDPITTLASSLTDVGDLRQLVAGTLDVETADLVRNRHNSLLLGKDEGEVNGSVRNKVSSGEELG